MTTLDRKKRGKIAETIALFFLKKKGYQVIANNYQKRCGEIDIITKKNNCFVFCEVKARFLKINQVLIEKPEVNLSHKKRQRILQTARCFIQEKHLAKEGNYRFDVLSLIFQNKKIKIRHFKYAFN